MKTLNKFLSLLVIVFTLITVFSCRKDDQEQPKEQSGLAGHLYRCRDAHHREAPRRQQESICAYQATDRCIDP